MSRKLFNYHGVDLCFSSGLPNSKALATLPIRALIDPYKNPLWLYRRDIIEERIDWLQHWPGLGRLHYAMKANFNLEILKVFQQKNCGIDAVSSGEMKQAIKAGFKPSDIILSGVGKSEEEILWAVENQIYQFNIESISEIYKLVTVCKRLRKKMNVAIRVNPEVDAETHPGIATALLDSKFGLDFGSAKKAVELIAQNPELSLKALSFHIGSQILNVKVFEKAIQAVKPFYLEVKKLCPELDRLDLGGGLGIDYSDADSEVDHKRWLALQAIYNQELKNFDAFVILEVGRFLVARSGILIAKVEVIKKTSSKNFMILDAGMSLLMRPALYQACHEIKPLKLKTGPTEIFTVVGPICESSDILATDKSFTVVAEGDLIAICDAGAYGSSMSSNYNLREPALEILI